MTDHADPDVRPRAEPNIDPRTGLLIPTAEDLMFMSLVTPGLDDAEGLSVLMWGAPGGGKTSMMKDAIRWAGRTPYYIDLSLQAPEDLAGIPRVSNVELSADGKIRVFLNEDEAGNITDPAPGQPANRVVTASLRAPDITWLKLSDDHNAVLVIDDITNALPAVQAAMLRVVLSREISDGRGGFVSLKHMPILAAANFGKNLGLNPLLGPLANRFEHVFWEQDPDGLAWWNSRRASQLTIDLDRASGIAERFDELLADKWEVVNDFVVEHQIEAFSPVPEFFHSVEEHAFATNRSYEMLIRSLVTHELLGVDPTRMMKGTIGADKAELFGKWMRKRELIRQVYDGSIDWSRHDPSTQRRVAEDAVKRFRADTRDRSGRYESTDDLVSLVGSLQKLREQSRGSEDVSRFPRDALLQRLGATSVIPGRSTQQVDATADERRLVREAFGERGTMGIGAA